MVAWVDGFLCSMPFHSAEIDTGRGAPLICNHISAESFSGLIQVQYQSIVNNSLNIMYNWR